MRQPSKPPHVAVKFLFSGGVHLPKSLHHHRRRPIWKHRFIRLSKTPTAKNFSRRGKEFLKVEPGPVGSHEAQSRTARTAQIRVLIWVGRGILVGLFRPFEKDFRREEQFGFCFCFRVVVYGGGGFRWPQKAAEENETED